VAFTAVTKAAKVAKGAKGAKAAKGAGAASRGAGARGAAGSRNLNDLPPEQRNAELQRRRAEAAAKAAEKAPADPVADAAGSDSAIPEEAGQPAAKGPGALARLDGVSPVHTGSGFVLGLIGWAFAVNYLRGGMPQVKQFARAKFLNQTGA
jgi:hypothetical protein